MSKQIFLKNLQNKTIGNQNDSRSNIKWPSQSFAVSVWQPKINIKLS